MKVSALEIDLRQLLVRHHDARGTSLRIQHALDVEAGLGSRGGDPVDFDRSCIHGRHSTIAALVDQIK